MLLDRSYQAGKTFNFGLYPAGDEWKLALTDGESGKTYLSDAFKFGGEQKLTLKEAAALPEGERANLRIITQNRRGTDPAHRRTARRKQSDHELAAPVLRHPTALYPGG